LIFFKVYWVAEKNADCPAQGIITTESECKVASIALGFNYDRQIRANWYRPAGCYKYRSKYSKNTYFNPITNPDDTSPKGFTSGICNKDE